jgi:hypothetical protein
MLRDVKLNRRKLLGSLFALPMLRRTRWNAVQTVAFAYQDGGHTFYAIPLSVTSSSAVTISSAVIWTGANC